MHILITGGCGFVGTNLIARLTELGGHTVRVLDDESTGKRHHLAGLPAEFMHGDIRDGAALGRALAGMDAVVHLAAHTRVVESVENPVINFDVNAAGSLAVLEAMRQRGVMRIVNASTGGAILGEAKPPVHEEMVPRPISPYGASKLCVEGYCSAYAGSYGMQALSLRFSNVYGPRSYHKGSVVAAFFKRVLAGQTVTIYGDGSQTRDFVFVEDLCDGIIAGLQTTETGVVQLGSGRPVTVNALLDAMEAVIAPRRMQREYEPFRDGEIKANWCDVSKARAVLGFAPKTSLEEGLARTWAWFNSAQHEGDGAAAN